VIFRIIIHLRVIFYKYVSIMYDILKNIISMACDILLICIIRCDITNNNFGVPDIIKIT
jgi:hypothetical protein